MKRRGGIAIALVAMMAAALASTAGAGSSATAKTQAVSCKSTLKLAFMGPLTGDAGFIGTEQLQWFKYAVKTLPASYGLKVTGVFGDTQLDAQIASSLAQKYVADKSVVAIIGPSTSGAVAATSKTFFQAGMAHISGSATNTNLTKKDPTVLATPAFFRVVPDDGIQGPGDARYMIEKLKAKKVVIIDSQDIYSVGLADAVQRYLKSKNVSVSRESVSKDTSDFSSVVTKVPSDADIVFFATQQPPKAQTLAQQLLEQGKKAKVFSSDGSNAPDKFKVAGSYLSNFAAPIDLFPYNKDIIAGWKKDNPSSKLGSFGPPTYGAVQVALNAIKRACDAGKGSIQDRRAVVRNVKKIFIKNWILGGSFRFSTKTNDPLNGQFVIFQIQPDGTYKLVS